MVKSMANKFSKLGFGGELGLLSKINMDSNHSDLNRFILTKENFNTLRNPSLGLSFITITQFKQNKINYRGEIVVNDKVKNYSTYFKSVSTFFHTNRGEIGKFDIGVLKRNVLDGKFFSKAIRAKKIVNYSKDLDLPFNRFHFNGNQYATQTTLSGVDFTFESAKLTNESKTRDNFKYLNNDNAYTIFPQNYFTHKFPKFFTDVNIVPFVSQDEPMEGLLVISTGTDTQQDIVYVSPHTKEVNLYNTLVDNKGSIKSTYNASTTSTVPGYWQKVSFGKNAYISIDLSKNNQNIAVSTDKGYSWQLYSDTLPSPGSFGGVSALWKHMINLSDTELDSWLAFTNAPNSPIMAQSNNNGQDWTLKNNIIFNTGTDPTERLGVIDRVESFPDNSSHLFFGDNELQSPGKRQHGQLVSFNTDGSVKLRTSVPISGYLSNIFADESNNTMYLVELSAWNSFQGSKQRIRQILPDHSIITLNSSAQIFNFPSGGGTPVISWRNHGIRSNGGNGEQGYPLMAAHSGTIIALSSFVNTSGTYSTDNGVTWNNFLLPTGHNINEQIFCDDRPTYIHAGYNHVDNVFEVYARNSITGECSYSSNSSTLPTIKGWKMTSTNGYSNWSIEEITDETIEYLWWGNQRRENDIIGPTVNSIRKLSTKGFTFDVANETDIMSVSGVNLKSTAIFSNGFERLSTTEKINNLELIAEGLENYYFNSYELTSSDEQILLDFITSEEQFIAQLSGEGLLDFYYGCNTGALPELVGCGETAAAEDLALYQSWRNEINSGTFNLASPPEKALYAYLPYTEYKVTDYLKQSVPLNSTPFFEIYNNLFNGNKTLKTGTWDGIVPANTNIYMEYISTNGETVGTNAEFLITPTGYNSMAEENTTSRLNLYNFGLPLGHSTWKELGMWSEDPSQGYYWNYHTLSYLSIGEAEWKNKLKFERWRKNHYSKLHMNSIAISKGRLKSIDFIVNKSL